MAAILMTSLLGPDAELRWANWLKLLQIPQSLILYRSPKIVTKFTRDHFFGPFDIDYVFNSKKSVLVNGPEDIHKLPVCANWHYKLNKHGRGVRVCFPMRITPKLYNKHVFDRKNGEVTKFSLPVEKIVIICAIEPFV